MSNEIQVTDANFEAEVIKSPLPVLVDFWAPWCGPCRMVGPVIDELAKEYAGKVKVCKLNTDENQDTAGKYQISAIPTMLLFKGGKLVEQLVGLQPKEELKKHLDELLA
ncbi:MAG: thioredoxin [Elusimicrobia bacterium GWB2_63_22]|nr:MAG: thioredoxin [Elusimicrobia bacterium GWB2_63_22]